MKNKLSLLLLATLFMLAQIACKNEAKTDLGQTSFIPLPSSVSATGDSFTFDESLVIGYEEGQKELEQTAAYLSKELERVTGIAFRVQELNQLPKEGIYLTLTGEDQTLGNEGYILNIGHELISINANGVPGSFYGVQTLLQTMPVKAEDNMPITIPTGIVRDFPEYEYRGAMLDVARHFFSVEDVKKFIDYLAMYKMNALHLHLSDDQGWRIEIKSWPKLTEIGSATEVGGGEGGFFTQEDYSEIVRYAMERHITIIPEIDMPGHTNAALASYPELNCDGKAPGLYTGIEVGFSTLCTDKEITYQFVDDVVGELAALTPGQFFHIGGDESHVTEHDDYVYFVNRVQEIVTAHGKRIIGWDEIANASLVDNSVVQFWANEKNTTMGVEQGAKVIISPARKAYLDMQYDSTTQLGLHWAAYIEVDEAYQWDPATFVDGVTKENILGVESPLWTETLTNIKEVEYMIFPRLPGIAEIGWTAPEQRDWNNYQYRLASHGKRFDAYDINFYKSSRVPWE